MAYDIGLAEVLRTDLQDIPDIVEKKMFGGLVFMQNGNMLCGVHANGGMYRVGKENADRALAIDGAKVMGFTGRPMHAFVDVAETAFADDQKRAKWLEMAQEFVGALPVK